MWVPHFSSEEAALTSILFLKLAGFSSLHFTYLFAKDYAFCQ
jgi:hypothetical protein